MAAVSAAAAVAVTREPFALAGAALVGAGFAAAIRALAGDSRASLAALAVAPLLAIASIAEHTGISLLPCVALAAMCWTVAELTRTTSSPLVAMLPATIAAVLEPAAVALIAIAGTRLVTAPWQRPRWAIAVPIAGGVAVLLAVIAGAAQGGMFATLGAHWFGSTPAAAQASLPSALADALGPFTAVAALAGLGIIARVRLAELAVATCIVGALLVDVRAGAIGPSTLGLAALCAGLAIGRFAGLVHLSSGQAIAGATAGMLLLVPPAWSAIEHGPRVSVVAGSR